MSIHDREPLDRDERELAQRLARLDAHAGPSPALDARILGAATEAVRPAAAAARVQPRRTRARWPVGLGVAASLAVAMGVAWQLRPLPETQLVSVPAESADAVQRVQVPTQPDAAKPVPDVPMDAPVMPEIAPADASVAPTATVDAIPLPAERDRTSSATRRAAADLPAQEAAAPAAAAAKASALRQMRSPPSPPAPMAGGAAPIVFDEVPPAPAPPPPPPSPPAPAAPSISGADAKATTPVFVPSPPAEAARTARAREEATRHQQRRFEAPAAQGAAAPRAVEELVATGSRVDRVAPQVDAMADQPYDDRPPATAASPQVRNPWLQRIRELRDAGKPVEARESLREFMRRHPDAVIPDDLRPLLDE